MGFVNWQYIVDQSDICTRFRNIGMVYTLNRTFEYEDRGNGQRKTQVRAFAAQLRHSGPRGLCNHRIAPSFPNPLKSCPE